MKTTYFPEYIYYPIEGTTTMVQIPSNHMLVVGVRFFAMWMVLVVVLLTIIAWAKLVQIK